MIREAFSSHTEPNINLEGTKEEIDIIRAMLLGKHWVSKQGDKITTVDLYKALPSPEDDPMIPPKWQTEFGSLPDRFAPELQEQIPEREKGGSYKSYSFYLKFLLHPKRDIPIIQDWGFECMRSRRGEDGKFWEVWYLPGDWASKGTLKKFVDMLPKDSDWEKRTELICHWIAKNVTFGSLDVVVQRMALANPD
jgi:hypothetical protein